MNNFAWPYDNGWELSPAYDLAFSTSLGNEHATAVGGNGKPATEDLLELADKAGLPKRKAEGVASEIQARRADLLEEPGLSGEPLA